MNIVLFALLFGTIGATLKEKAKRLYIGSAISVGHFNDSEYKSTAVKQFNCVTAENEMKWGPLMPQKDRYDFTRADQIIKFAQLNAMKIRGHTLVWHTQLPDWVKNLTKDELHEAMINHINETMTHFKGKIYAWDVINELINEQGVLSKTIFTDHFGESFIADAFKTARAVDPNAKLYLNDVDHLYGYLNQSRVDRMRDGLYNYVKKWKSEGVPIDGIGIQAHYKCGGVPDKIQENLQRFADLGLDVAITELDIHINLGQKIGDNVTITPATTAQLEQQAKDYAKVVSACVNVKRCVGVTVWEFSDKGFGAGLNKAFKAYFGQSKLFDQNYNPKPAVSAVESVLQ